MLSNTIPPQSIPPETPPTESEVLIQRRIEQTGRHVKGVDIADGLMTLAIGVLTCLLVVAAIDHWLIPGGLGFWGRFGLWLLFIGSVTVFFVYRLLPPLIYRINPLFAATTIEQSRPSLKNSLLNFLLFRHHRQNVAPIVYQSMERRAAADLAEVELDVAIDRTHVIHLGYVLVGVFALFCLYLVVSPKNPIRSAGRVLWPWSNIEAPTRVTIHDVQPGNTTAFLGEFVTVSAELSGLDDGEPALAIYSTADGQTVDQEVPMTLPEGDYRRQCRLPPGNLGLQQDITYFLAAGDCRTRRYRIESQVAPAIAVEKVLFHYPGYTGLADRTVERQGDLRAIEGTEATIHATANTEIKPGTAEIDRGCTGRQGIRMTTDGRTAVGCFTLRLHPKDSSAAEFDSYRLRFADSQGRENTRPIRYRIDVIRDLPPTVQWIEPQQEEVQVPLNGALAIRVRAEDPDFGLRCVVLRAQCNNKSLPIAPLLDQEKPAQARMGEFTGTYSFEPQRLRLKVGDRVEYWVEAKDNREPTPGESVSGKQRIVVIGSEKQQSDRGGDKSSRNDKAAADDRADNKNKTHEPAENNPAKQPKDQQSPSDDNQQKQQNESPDQSQPKNASDSSSADQGKDEASSGKAVGGENRQQQGNGQSDDLRQGGQQGEKNNTRIDPDAAPGDAMQEILNDRRKEQEQKPSSDKQSGSDVRSSEAGQSNERKADNKTENGEKGEEGVKENSGSQQGGVGERGAENAGDEKSGKQNGGGKGGDEKAQSRQGGAGGQGAENAGDEKSGKQNGGGKGGDEKAQSRQGGAGEQDKDKTSETGENGSDKPTNDGRQDTKKPGEGKNAGNNAGSPASENQNIDREKKPGKAGDESGEPIGDMAQSPSTGKHQSDSQGETAGDRSGGGEQGGGQKANRTGMGSSGSHLPADEGASQSDESGEGEIGNEAGDRNIAKPSTDSTAKTPASEGVEGQQGMKGKKGEKGAKSADGKVGDREGANNGMPGGGGKPGTPSNTLMPPEPDESPADQANLEYARRQTGLALEHLRDQLTKENPELLERLGWTKDDARRFLNRWESMRRAAAEKSPAGENARKQLDDALRSLGLRPRGAELHHGGIATDQPQNLRDAGRFAPPSDWAEQFREYTHGVAGRDERRGEGK